MSPSLIRQKTPVRVDDLPHWGVVPVFDSEGKLVKIETWDDDEEGCNVQSRDFQ